MSGAKSYDKQKENGETEDEETIASYKEDITDRGYAEDNK